jgi:O-antigen/teichoic acid export membrane protein
MRLIKLIFGELILILASVLIFRSLWTLMDQYFGSSNLEGFLVIGLVIAVLVLIWLNRQVKPSIVSEKNV